MKENTKRAKTGDKVIVQIKKWPRGRRNPEGKVIEIIGKEGDVGVDVDSIMDYLSGVSFTPTIVTIS